MAVEVQSAARRASPRRRSGEMLGRVSREAAGGLSVGWDDASQLSVGALSLSVGGVEDVGGVDGEGGDGDGVGGVDGVGEGVDGVGGVG